MPLLEANNVSVRFGGLLALSDFSFALDQGQLVGLIGPNGAGKTTAFNIITGVYRPTSGEIRLGNRRIDGLTPDFKPLYERVSEAAEQESPPREKRAVFSDFVAGVGTATIALGNEAKALLEVSCPL